MGGGTKLVVDAPPKKSSESSKLPTTTAAGTGARGPAAEAGEARGRGEEVEDEGVDPAEDGALRGEDAEAEAEGSSSDREEDDDDVSACTNGVSALNLPLS